MTAVTALGLVAGALTTTAFIPQVLRVWRTRSTRDISLGMFLLFTLGVALWLVYGVLVDAPPVVIANGVTLALSATILGFKLRYK